MRYLSPAFLDLSIDTNCTMDLDSDIRTGYESDFWVSNMDRLRIMRMEYGQPTAIIICFIACCTLCCSSLSYLHYLLPSPLFSISLYLPYMYLDVMSSLLSAAILFILDSLYLKKTDEVFLCFCRILPLLARCDKDRFLSCFYSKVFFFLYQLIYMCNLIACENSSLLHVHKLHHTASQLFVLPVYICLPVIYIIPCIGKIYLLRLCEMHWVYFTCSILIYPVTRFTEFSFFPIYLYKSFSPYLFRFKITIGKRLSENIPSVTALYFCDLGCSAIFGLGHLRKSDSSDIRHVYNLSLTVYTLDDRTFSFDHDAFENS